MKIIEDFATLLKEADEKLEHEEAATACQKFEEARQTWKNKFSSVSDQLLGQAVRIYRGLNKALIEKEEGNSSQREVL
jgi:hemerythrin-like domain-containing protein